MTDKELLQLQIDTAFRVLQLCDLGEGKLYDAACKLIESVLVDPETREP